MMMQTALALAVFCVCVWAVVSPAIHSCIAGTLGLSLVGGAALLSLDYYGQPVVQMMMAGVMLCGVQVMWRVWRARRWHVPRRRAEDWRTSGEPPAKIADTDLWHIAGGKR
jgi:hypothetical protein